MTILANDESIEESDEPSLKKSKYIICPQCKENIRIKINNYKIELFDCINSHSFKNLSFDDFEKSQNIDETKIICDFCKSANKSNTYENLFYICFSCNKKICPLCKSSHDKNHLMIDYDEKYFKCNEHNESYTLYCEQCKKNICILCEKAHINHKKISHGEIMPDKNKLENEKNELRKKLDEFENEAQKIINILNNIIKNFEIYYKIYNDMINNYVIQKRNFQILQNLNDINDYNINFIKELDIIIKEKNINYKFEKIMNIWDKINLNEKDIIKNKEEVNDIKNKAKEDKEDKIYELNEINIKKILARISKVNPPKNKTGLEIIDKYESFDIGKIKESKSFAPKNSIEKIILLKDQRILSFNSKIGAQFSVYRYENGSFKCDLYSNAISGLEDMIQLYDGNIVMGERFYILKIIKFEEKDFKILKEKKIDIRSPKLYKLSNGKIIVYSAGNKIVYIYSYTENDLIYEDYINTEKYGVLDVCEINKKEIAVSCYEFGKIYGKNYFIIFYDVEKKVIIKTFSIGSKFCYMNKNSLIVVSDKIYLIDLNKHKIKTKISCKNNECINYSVLKINEKGFIVIRDNMYYYEIENDSKIIFKGQSLFGVVYADKYPGNRLIIGKYGSIYIYNS